MYTTMNAKIHPDTTFMLINETEKTKKEPLTDSAFHISSHYSDPFPIYLLDAEIIDSYFAGTSCHLYRIARIDFRDPNAYMCLLP